MAGLSRIVGAGGLAVVGLLAGLVFAGAAEQGDAARGARLAQRWCASCHLVTPDQAKGAVDAPSFMALARDPAKTAEGIADFLTLPGTTHSKMPDLHLSRVEIVDIVAHITSLKK